MCLENNENIKWAFLCSFWGKNAIDVIKWHAERNCADKIGLLVYEQENCGAAIEAQRNGIKTLHMPLGNFQNKSEHQNEILNALSKEKISNIFLLGFQHLISDIVLSPFSGRIVNIHPSLFPSFLGTKTAIQDALDYGVKISGITTHIIDNRFDRGIILCQEPIRINDNDSFDTLYPRFSEKGLELIVDTMEIMEKRLLTKKN